MPTELIEIVNEARFDLIRIQDALLSQVTMEDYGADCFSSASQSDVGRRYLAAFEECQKIHHLVESLERVFVDCKQFRTSRRRQVQYLENYDIYLSELSLSLPIESSDQEMEEESVIQIEEQPNAQWRPDEDRIVFFDESPQDNYHHEWNFQLSNDSHFGLISSYSHQQEFEELNLQFLDSYHLEIESECRKFKKRQIKKSRKNRKRERA